MMISLNLLCSNSQEAAALAQEYHCLFQHTTSEDK